MPGRDPEDRTRQLCNALEGRHRDRRAGALRAHRPPRRAARGLPRRADPPGQRPLEAARDEGDRLPPGLLVRRLPRAAGDDHVLDLAPRDAGRRRADRVRPRLAHVAEVAAGALAVPRARRLARRRARRRARGHRARDSSRSSSSRRRLVPPRPHVARLGTEHERDRSRAWRSSRTCSRSRRASTRRTSTSTYSRYRRRGDLSLDESFFPVLWDETGYRTPWLASLPAID